MPRLTWEKITLKLKNPFRLSYGVSETRDAFWLRLNGDEGWGEGTIPPYYSVDPSAMTGCWQRAAESSEPFPDSIETIPNWIPDGPAPARSAIELALLDRLAKAKASPLHKLLGIPSPGGLSTAFTIGIDAPEAMAKMAEQIRDYPIIKIKLGSEDDESRVRAIREARPDAKLIIDANAGWTFQEAVVNLKWLEGYRIELIEQPLGKARLKEMGELQKQTSIPVIADESVQSLGDVQVLGAAGVAGINVKLMKLGGLIPALAIIQKARAMKMKVMLGCMIETSLGVTAMAQLAGLADWVDLDSPLLVSNDPFNGIQYDRNARISLPDKPGIGVTRRLERDRAA